MSRVLTISDTLYTQLESISRSQGLTSIEELLEQSVPILQAEAVDLHNRQDVVERIDTLRERLFAKYREQPDSVELIRADRER